MRLLRARLTVAAGLIGLAACGPKRIPAPAPVAAPPPLSLLVLLPDSSGGAGLATITNPAGSQELVTPYTAVRVANNNTPPSAPAAIDPAVVRQIFGGALDALPPEEMVFTLHFTLGTTTLDASSEAALPALLAAARDRGSTIVSVTGHTDNTGTSRDANYRLGLERANAVAERLRNIGVSPDGIMVRSHGQTNPLVPTPPNTAEARNRRVEVILH